MPDDAPRVEDDPALRELLEEELAETRAALRLATIELAAKLEASPYEEGRTRAYGEPRIETLMHRIAELTGHPADARA